MRFCPSRYWFNSSFRNHKGGDNQKRFAYCFTVLAVVICLVITPAFAAGEQPSGSSYIYYAGSGYSAGYSDYWSATSQSLARLADYIQDIYFRMPSSSSGGSSSFNSNDSNNLGTVALRSIAIDGNTSNIYQVLNYVWDDVSSIYNMLINWNDYVPLISGINTNTSNIKSYTSSILGDFEDFYTDWDDWWNYDFFDLSRNVDNIDTRLQSFFNLVGNTRSYSYTHYSGNTESSIVRTSQTFSGLISTYFSDHIDLLDKLTYMFADDSDIELKMRQALNTDSVIDDFFSGSSSSTSIGVSDIGNVKDAFYGVADIFDTSVGFDSSLDYLTVLEDGEDGKYPFFSNQTKANLDSVGLVTASRYMSNGVDLDYDDGDAIVDYYGSKMDAFDDALEVASDS